MFRTQAKQKINEELSRGAMARRDGLEGRARVCARRAAGEAVREYLRLSGQAAPGSSAYDLLSYLQTLPEITDGMRLAAGRLIIRVDETFALPNHIDLLADASWLAQSLETLLENKES